MGSTYCLLTVLPHSKAYEYAASRRCTVNQVLGVLEMRNEEALEKVAPALARAAESGGTFLFAHVSNAAMRRLGIDDKTPPAARMLTSEQALDALQPLQPLQPLLPEAQAAALYALACGMPVEDAWREVAPYLAPDIQQPVNTSDILTAISDRSPGRAS